MITCNFNKIFPVTARKVKKGSIFLNLITNDLKNLIVDRRNL